MDFFDRLLDNELVWFPEIGFGYYPVKDAPYDRQYFDRYRKQDWTAVGDALNDTRVAMVKRHASHLIDPILCDVGIGGGRFVVEAGKALKRIRVRGFDVNPCAVQWLSEHGLLRDPNSDRTEIATFWDSLEHIHDPSVLLRNVSELVFVSIPIFRDAEHIKGSKHFRKDEHCLYFTRGGFIRFMTEHGFALLEVNTMEQAAGREDIESFAFVRVRDERV